MNFQKIIHVSQLNSRMEYPVGSYVSENIPYIKAMGEAIKQHFPGYVRLICRGSSGAIIAGIIAPMLKHCEIMYIKKPGEVRHSGTYARYSSIAQPEYNVIVDDFVSTGETIRELHKAAQRESLKVHGLVVSGYVDTSLLNGFHIETLISGTRPPEESPSVSVAQPDSLTFTL